MSDLISKSLFELRSLLTKKEVSSFEVTQAFYQQIEKYNPQLNAFITVNDKALDEAKKIDSGACELESPLLKGLPIAVKDMFCTEGIKTTAASKMLKTFVPPYSATVVQRLKSHGAIVIGKCNQDEFAMGATNEYSAYGACLNPWDSRRVAGGSSGGSVAAVASYMSPASLGTDTGGSVRAPAHYCGLFGVKPTYGRVSRYGIIAFASSLDQAGVCTRTVKDGALLLEAISGHDVKDATSASESVPEWSAHISRPAKGQKVGLLLPSKGIDKEVVEAIGKAKDILEDSGVVVEEVSLEALSYAVCIYYIIVCSEAASNLARYDGIRFGERTQRAEESLEDFYGEFRNSVFGKEVKRRILVGTYALSSGYYEAYYKKACQARHYLSESLSKILNKYHAIVAPVTTTPAPPLGLAQKHLIESYKSDRYTMMANLSGRPAVSVPVCLSSGGLPIGVQLIGRHFDEQTLLNLSQSIEDAAGFPQCSKWL